MGLGLRKNLEQGLIFLEMWFQREGKVMVIRSSLFNNAPSLIGI